MRVAKPGGGGIPALGSRGEGWVVLQFVLLGLCVAAAYLWPAGAAGIDAGLASALGVLCIVGGLAVMVWGAVALRAGHALTAVPYPTPESDLVDTGPYRFVRHPIYSGLILGALGVSIARESIAALVAAVVLAVVLDLKRRREEGWLVERHPGYVAYRARTHALVPFLY